MPDLMDRSTVPPGRLQRRGFFVEVGRRLRLQRKAGSYVGIDLVAFRVAYHAAYALPPGAGVRRRCHGLDDRGAGLAGYGLANWGARP